MIIACHNLQKTYVSNQGAVEVLNDVSFSVRRGEILCIVGPSGCGKTSLLRIISCLDEPDSGTIAYTPSNGDIDSVRAMVFQEHALFPWKTVRENICFGYKDTHQKGNHRSRNFDELLDLMGLQKFADYYPHQLSTGMCQRVNLARAFARNSELLLMDEPFSALDMQSRLLLQEELLRFWNRTGNTIIFVTHDIPEAVRMADRIVVMSSRPGTVKEILDVQAPRPSDPAAVFGSDNSPLIKHIWNMLESDVRISLNVN